MSAPVTIIQEQPYGNDTAESMVIGAMLIDNRWIDRAAEILHPDDFSNEVFGLLYRTILLEYSQGKAVNPVTMRPIMQAHSELGLLPAEYLVGLTAQISIVYGAKDLMKQVAELATRRRLAEGLRAASDMVRNSAVPLAKAVDAADGAITDSMIGHDPLHQVTGAKAIDELLATYDKPVSGVVCTTISSVDQALGALRPKSLTIAAGRPGMGKTALAISYALGAVQGGNGTLFISVEMSSVELAGRMVSDLCFDGHSGIPYEQIREGRLSQAQYSQVVRARQMVHEMPLYIVDAGAMTIGRVAMLVRRYKRRLEAKGEKLNLVIVDYLQLLSADGKHANRNEVVGEISRGLKVIAKDQDVAVLALSQLSREVEKRADKRPTLSDLRESGSIEQDADAVMFLYRHEYYLRLAEPDEQSPERAAWQASLNECAGKIDFIVAKHRNGSPGTRQGMFYAANQAVR